MGRRSPGSRRPAENRELAPLIAADSGALGLTRRKIGADEIVERCLLALVDEGADVLADGAAQHASDIDAVCLNGYGFPRRRGGPMYWADSEGQVSSVRKTRRFARNPHGDPAFWTPHPLLAERAERLRSLLEEEAA